MSTHIFLVLDMTGSMSWKKEATIDACNEFITAQQSTAGAADLVFTLGVFNSNIGLERIVDGVPIERAPLIEHEHYRPDGATPLYDSIAEAISLLESYQGQVLVIIQTDGEENSSKHVTKEEVVKRVGEKTAAGWQFLYLGCDIDAMGHGGELGIAAGNTMTYARSNTDGAFRALSHSTRAYLDGGSSSSGSFFPGPPVNTDDTDDTGGPVEPAVDDAR